MREEEIVGLKKELERLSRAYGFPRRAPNLKEQQKFDREVCRYLKESEFLIRAGGETLRPDCWAGLVCLHFLDLVVWRFGGQGSKIARERLEGRERNFLRRLWLRIRTLYIEDSKTDDPWQLVDALTEDAVVQIIERPSIAADPRLAQVIGRCWLELAKTGRSMEDLTRRAIKRVRAIAEVRLLSALGDAELEEIVREAFGVNGRSWNTPRGATQPLTGGAHQALDLDATQREASRQQQITGGQTNAENLEDSDYQRHVETVNEKNDLEMRCQNIDTFQLAEAVDIIISAAREKKTLSPKSHAALVQIRSGNYSITRRQKKSLKYLLDRLSHHKDNDISIESAIKIIEGYV
ncbi:hypothetical protein D6833_09130 [Candidatus Parcubacteria bacterium]|nr:MAG: hypothetical protein D6833_09130 [Candidatus Parcubacteria bacterium]